MVTPKTRPEQRKHAIVVLHLAGPIFSECHLLGTKQTNVAELDVRSKQERTLQLPPDYRDLIFALILHSQRNLYASCRDYTQREKLDET